jgi:hypothetical protein
LHFSPDGGRTFTELLRRPGKLFGFAFSPTNDAVLVGYGDSVDAGASSRS